MTALDSSPRAALTCAPGDPVLLRWLGWLTAGISVSAFLGMTITTLLGVAARYLGVRGVEWSFEVAGIMFLWTSFFGALLAELRHENVALTLLVDRLGKRSAQVIAFLAAVGTLWFLISLCKSGLAFADRTGTAPTPVLRLPRVVEILPLIAFAAGGALIFAIRLAGPVFSRRRA